MRYSGTDSPILSILGDTMTKSGKREFTKEFTKDGGEFTKEFAKAKREIYRCISSDSHITRTQMAEHIGLSVRQVQKYLKRLTDLGLIIRERWT